MMQENNTQQNRPLKERLDDLLCFDIDSGAEDEEDAIDDQRREQQYYTALEELINNHDLNINAPIENKGYHLVDADYDGYSPLQVAICEEDERLLSLLMRRPDLDVTSAFEAGQHQNESPILAAIEQGCDKESIYLLLEREDVDPFTSETIEGQQTSAIQKIAESGDGEYIRLIVEYYPDLLSAEQLIEDEDADYKEEGYDVSFLQYICSREARKSLGFLLTYPDLDLEQPVWDNSEDYYPTLVHYLIAKGWKKELKKCAEREDAKSVFTQDLYKFAVDEKKTDILQQLKIWSRQQKITIDPNFYDPDEYRKERQRELIDYIGPNVMRGFEHMDSSDFLEMYQEEPPEDALPVLHQVLKKATSNKGGKDVRKGRERLLKQILSTPEIDLAIKNAQGQGPDSIVDTRSNAYKLIKQMANASKAGIGTTTGGSSSDDSEEEHRPRVENKIFKRIIEEPNDHAFTRTDKELLDDLNQRLQNKEIISEQEWNKYPFIVVNFRGIHLARHHFTHAERHNFVRNEHAGKPLYSSVFYSDNKMTFAASIPTQKVERVKELVEKLFSTLRNMPGPISSKTNRLAHHTARDHLQQLYTNNQAAFDKKIWAEIRKNIPDLPNDIAGNIFVSTSKTPEHALRYVFGQSFSANTKEYRVNARMRPSGQAKYRNMGMVFGIFHPIKDYLVASHTDVNQLHAKRKIHANYRFMNETEVSYEGWIDGKRVAFAVPIMHPSFEKLWDREYHPRHYGLDQEQYEKYQWGFNTKTKRHSKEHRALEDKLRKDLISHLSGVLDNLAKSESVRMGNDKKLVYVDSQGILRPYENYLETKRTVVDGARALVSTVTITNAPPQKNRNGKRPYNEGLEEGAAVSILKARSRLEEWYTEDQIHHILVHALPGPYTILAQTQFEHRDLVEGNIRTAIDAVTQGHIAAVMPIHLHGNHWTGAVFRRQTDHTLEVIYMDPTGSSFEAEENASLFIETITSMVPRARIIDLKFRQQENGYDCGPFTVDNLIRIAQAPNLDNLDGPTIITLAALQAPKDGSARFIRHKHHRLLDTQGAVMPSVPSNVKSRRLSFVEQIFGDEKRTEYLLW